MILDLSPQAFRDFLAGLHERDDRLDVGAPSSPDEKVDEYVFSGHVEALRSEEIDGDVWGTLEDLELEAKDEDEAWEKVKAWYVPRSCVVLRVGEDEYVLAEELARRLNLLV